MFIVLVYYMATAYTIGNVTLMLVAHCAPTAAGAACTIKEYE